MHRDIIRYVTLLAVVRLLCIAACPAPNPWAKPQPDVRPAQHLPDDCLCRCILSRPTTRPRDRVRAAPCPRFAAAGRRRLAGALPLVGADLDRDGGAASPPARNSRRACGDVTIGRNPGGQSQRSDVPLYPEADLEQSGGEERRPAPAGPGRDVTPAARPPRSQVPADSGVGAPAYVPETAPGLASAAAPRTRRDRPTHRGRRSYVRKRGPRRHRGQWTDDAGPRELKMCAVNIQSLKPKFFELCDEIKRFSYDFVVISETWLKPCTPNRLLPLSGYVVKRCDRAWPPRGYGGVAILYREKYQHKTIAVPERVSDISKLEALWSLFKWDNGRVIVASLYRPPRHTVAALQADFDTLEAHFQHVLTQHPDCPIVLAGDLNCDLLSDSSPSKQCLLEFITKYSLNQAITSATYKTGSLLDVLISNRAFSLSSTRFCHFSPHRFVRAVLCVPRPRFKPRVIMCRSFKRFDLLGFENALLSTDWSLVFSAFNVSDAWSAFLRAINPIVSHYAPVKSVTVRNPSAPPISDSTRVLITQRAQALRVWGHGSEQYRSANRLARAAYRGDRRRHIGSRLQELGRTGFWRAARDLVGSKRSSAGVIPTTSADDMNNFFVNVGPSVAAELEAQGPPPSLPTLLPRVGACSFSLHPISLSALHRIIFSMRNSPARGADGLCIRLLKLAFNSIGHVLLFIINSCIATNDVPQSWKHSIVHPIHKSGDPSNPSNFRPISILPVIAKIVERTVQRQLYYYLSSNHLLAPTQHGFRPRHSTETALTSVSDHLLSAIDSGKISLLCLIDLSKCFDVIHHGKLLEKLQTLSIDISWFQNYLHGHTQSVSFTGSDGKVKISHPRSIHQGVFQGSSLGPILFCAFANDLGLHAADALVVQYADDTQVIISEPKSCLSALITRMEFALSSLGNYFLCNGLKVNVTKFELLTIGSRQNLRSLPNFTVKFRDTLLSPCTEARNLGVIFDQHLSWDAHVTALSRKCCGILVSLSHLRHFLPAEILPDIVSALVLSHIRYCLVVYGSGSARNLHRIQKLLNFAARIVSGKRKHDRISAVRDALGWLDSPKLLLYQTLCLLHRVRRTAEPVSLADLFTTNTDRPDRSRSTRQDRLLFLPRVRTETGKRRFAYRAALASNRLPSEFTDMTVRKFKRELKPLLQSTTAPG